MRSRGSYIFVISLIPYDEIFLKMCFKRGFRCEVSMLYKSNEVLTFTIIKISYARDKEKILI